MYDCPAQDAPLTYKFTGKERDSESGLDNFGARYNSSNLGRFMSPDKPFADQTPDKSSKLESVCLHLEQPPQVHR